MEEQMNALQSNDSFPSTTRLPVLDGWRAISILCVLAGHMLPLGPKYLSLNEMTATAGMSIFFFLSGFLIVSMLARNPNVLSFLVRRLTRIIPLAWLFLLVVWLTAGPDSPSVAANFLFYANLPPTQLFHHAEHFWSLCVEMQFYAAIAAIIAVAGHRGLWLVPIACILVTIHRIAAGEHISIVTWARIDEILIGGCAALAIASARFSAFTKHLSPAAPFLVVPFFLASCHGSMGGIEYARPYLTALLIASTIHRNDDAFQRVLTSRPLSYLARISYALYVIHPATYAGWLGEGDWLVKYSKRILSFTLTFGFAHVSTHYYENHFISLGHRIADRIEPSKPGRNAIASAPTHSRFR
uniref:Acyltransferase 3 n=1 Tax=Rhodopseudomonas palustris (strain BisA53) TaxID=316055 RepID=Q07SM2_RHOP5